MRIPGAGRIRAALRWSARAIRRRSSHGVVLLYHRIAGPRFDPLLLDVSTENFDAHLRILRESAAVLPLDEFETARRGGTLPARAVAITFDDGYADNSMTAAPALGQHGLAATFFITSGMVGSPSEFWWDEVERLVASPTTLDGTMPWAPVQWAGERVAAPLGAPWSIESVERPPRARLFLELLDTLRVVPAPARERALSALRAWANVPDAARDSHRAVTAQELLDLARRSGVTIGAHTVTHPPLAMCDAQAQLREMTESRVALAQRLGREIRLFAYPFGTHAEVSAMTVRVAASAGFDAAMANEPRAAWRWSSRWRVPRVLVRNWSGDEFRQRLAGWWDS